MRMGGLLAVAAATIVFVSVIQEGLRPFEYAVYPIEDSLARGDLEIAREVSRCLWGIRSLDLIALAFLLVVAAACCVTILSPREKRRRR